MEIGRGSTFSEGKVNRQQYSRSIEHVISDYKPTAATAEKVEQNSQVYNTVVENAKRIWGNKWKENLGNFDLKTVSIEYQGVKYSTADLQQMGKSNPKFYAEVVEKGKHKKVKYYTAVTKEMRDRLYDINESVAHWMANHPMYGGKGLFNTEMKQEQLVKAEDFSNAFKQELSEFTRTWNPAENPSFGAYLLGQIKKRYPKILDTLAKKEAKLLVDETGKEYDIESLDNYQRFESIDIMEASRIEREQRELAEKVSSVVEESKLRNEIGIENVEKAEIFRKVEMDLLRTKDRVKKDFLS